MTYQFIKTKSTIKDELYHLWDNYPLYRFICDAQYIRKRELDISECLIDREQYIEQCRYQYKIDKIPTQKQRLIY